MARKYRSALANTRTATLNSRVTPELYELFWKAAEEEGRSVSGLLEQIVLAFLKKRGEAVFDPKTRRWQSADNGAALLGGVRRSGWRMGLVEGTSPDNQAA